jgi:predicted nucleic acid-binding protein
MQSNIFCLDTSVLVPVLVKEAMSRQAQRLLLTLEKTQKQMLAPALLPIEFYSVIRKKHSLGQLTFAPKQTLKFFWQLDIVYQPINRVLLDKAYKLAQQLQQRTVYDCLFLVLAQELDAYLITVDQKFAHSASNTYNKILNIKQALELIDA